MHHLERYYSGNENWIVFSKLYEAYKDIEKVQGLARKFNDDLILAVSFMGGLVMSIILPGLRIKFRLWTI